MLADEARAISNAPDIEARLIGETIELYDGIIERIRMLATAGSRYAYIDLMATRMKFTVSQQHISLVQEKLRRDGYKIRHSIGGFAVAW